MKSILTTRVNGLVTTITTETGPDREGLVFEYRAGGPAPSSPVAPSLGISGTDWSIIAVYRGTTGTIVAEDNEASRGFALRVEEFEINGGAGGVVPFNNSGERQIVSVIGTGEVFLNGESAATFTQTLDAHTGALFIGAREFVGVEQPLTGHVETVLIFNRAISPEVRAAWEASL